MPNIQLDIERCKGCERCNDVCPQKILAMSENYNTKGYRYAMVSHPPKCIGCRLCAITCPDVAIEVFVQGTQYRFFDY